MMHERFIEWITMHGGVEWCTSEEMAQHLRTGEMQGVDVEGGVDA